MPTPEEAAADQAAAREATAVPAESDGGVQLDAGRVIDSLQRQLSAANLEVAKRDALLEQVQDQARTEMTSMQRVVEAQQQEITRLKGEMDLLTNPEAVTAPDDQAEDPDGSG